MTKTRSKPRRPKRAHRPPPRSTKRIGKRPRPPKRPHRPPVPRFNPWTHLLGSVPGIENAIVWRAPGPAAAVLGVPTPYPQWTRAQQGELENTWTRILNGTQPPISFEPKVDLTINASKELFATLLKPAAAWKYFIRYVAQSLAVESRRSVPWSLRDYAVADLYYLLDSDSLFSYSSTLGQYNVDAEHPSLPSHGASQPGDPVRTEQKLRALGLVGRDQRSTIDFMLDWCRANMTHFYGSYAVRNLEAYWQYKGWPPVDRVLAGTTHPQWGFAHWTAGCWGTAGFLRNTLRTINIPTSHEARDGHALPHFHLPHVRRVSKDLYLSHGDDPYNWGWISTPAVPIDNLPIDDALFQQWFGPGAAMPPGGSNVGRQTAELSIQFLSNYLLRLHCADLAAGRAPAQSQVFDPQYGGLGLYYTVAQLQAQQLWQRLDAKLTAIGGCANVPPP
jgi:hypothetical protein